MAGTYSNLIFHIVFSTKNREAIIGSNTEVELYQYITGIVQGEKAGLLKINGTNNHVHLIVKMKPTHSIPDIIKRIKANSSKWMNKHRKINRRFSWQSGYGIFSISESQLPQVIKYVADQKKHHKHRSFKEELLQLLDKHRIDYDPKYLWV